MLYLACVPSIYWSDLYPSQRRQASFIAVSVIWIHSMYCTLAEIHIHIELQCPPTPSIGIDGLQPADMHAVLHLTRRCDVARGCSGPNPDPQLSPVPTLRDWAGLPCWGSLSCYAEFHELCFIRCVEVVSAK